MNRRLLVRAWSVTLALALIVADRSFGAEPLAVGQFDEGLAAFQRGALPQAAMLWADAAQSYEKQGQVAGQISALTHLADAQAGLGQYRQAAASLGTALDLANVAGDRRRAALIGAALGNVLVALGALEPAETYLRNALGFARELPDPALAAATLNDLGNLLSTETKYAEAVAAYSESIVLASDPGQRLLRARTRSNAVVALREE